MTNRLIALGILSLVLLLVLWLMGSFVGLTFNPLAWPLSDRVVITLLFFGVEIGMVSDLAKK